MSTRLSSGPQRLTFLTVSIALHVLVIIGASQHLFGVRQPAKVQELEAEVFFIKAEPPPSAAPQIEQTMSTMDADTTKAKAEKTPATMSAPSAPTAEEWAFAAQYTNKNSKGYRHSWGQQVRSMMGTAVEGPDQGEVRFRIEIAPNGTLAQLDTLWSTSTLAEKLARQAIQNMPPLPPTPTGKPLIFEKTISFSPFASDGAPSYKDDCLPDTPSFKNPFAWNGKSEQTKIHSEPPQPKLDAKAMEACLRQLPKDSIEAEMARDQRVMDQWGSSKTGR
nr:energy transducer TonB [uncultured Limnohabitans sp.]